MQFRRRTLRTAIIASAALGLIAGGSVLALTSRSGATESLALSAAQTSTGCAAAWSSTAVYTAATRPARTASTTPPTGGPRATTRRPTTAAAARDSRGHPTARAPAVLDQGRARPECQLELGIRDGYDGLGERRALQPVQGRHHQHELEHRPDAVGRGRQRPAGRRLRSLVSTYVPKLPAITLAFATGACGSENWGGVPGASFASENVPQLQAAGRKYVVSTGGEAGTFTCTSASGMESFIARYASPHLVGIEFDIEAAIRVGHPEPGRLGGGSAGAVPEHPVLVHPRHPGRV